MTEQETRKLFYARMIVHSLVAIAKYDTALTKARQMANNHDIDMYERNIAIQLRNRREWQKQITS